MPLNLDEFLQHELYLNRLASGGINSYVYPSLTDTYKAVRRILQDEEIITSTAQLNKVTAAISRAIDANGGWLTMTQESLDELAVYETSWQAQFIGASLAIDIQTPAEKKILSYVNNALMSLDSGQRTYAGTWAQFYQENLDSRKRAINGIIKTGYAQGQTINQMSQRIRTNIDGVLKREAEALARTGYQHYASQARKAIGEANKDILTEIISVAVFDNHTTLQCASLNGKRWDINAKNIPWVPRHFKCRSVMLYIPKGTKLTGTRSALGAKASGKEAFKKKNDRLRTKSQVRYSGKKDLNIFKPEQIGANTSFGSWLGEQPRYYINDTLGPKRAELFVSGQLTIEKFTDLTGRPLTLQQLKDKYPSIDI